MENKRSFINLSSADLAQRVKNVYIKFQVNSEIPFMMHLILCAIVYALLYQVGFIAFGKTENKFCSIPVYSSKYIFENFYIKQLHFFLSRLCLSSPYHTFSKI